MKKKYSVTDKDKKDWSAFTKRLEDVYDKEANLLVSNSRADRIRRLDLHGYSLDQANKTVKKFILESFEDKYKKLLIITGKGTRSKVSDNPYLSDKLNILRNSVPEYIKNDESLYEKIKKISEADIKDGGKGAFYIYLK